MIKHFVLKNSGTEAEAADVFQDALIVLFEKVQEDSFKLTVAIQTFIYSICRNIWLKKLRDEKRLPKVQDFEQFIQVETDTIDEELNERQETILAKCLNKLGDPCKTLLTQFYYLKKKTETLAQELNYASANAVKSQKYKCLKRLKTMALEALNDGA